MVLLFADSRGEADDFLPQTTSIRKKLLSMHKGRPLTLLSSLLVNLKREKIMTEITALRF